MNSLVLDDEAIFHAARGIPDLERRRDYVRGACGQDTFLVAHVEALLAAADVPDRLLDRPVVGDRATPIDTPASEAVGTVVGPYTLLEKVGEGGMGVVYVAEQTHPVKRRVALKVIKPGMDTAEVIARFEAERQALALMDHPNIAKVLDAGASPPTAVGGSARPYFVMELVRGLTITDYCDQARLPADRRLRLFAQVCRAVQHAHQKGVIHRDLKPSNVLVTLHDGEPVPKVIDFGVAKAIDQRLTDKPAYTRLTQMVGTPLYMAPEQAELSGLDIDTRSDVYALGVLLYELLTGTTPFDAETLRTAGFDEMRRMIREDDPPRPSARVSTLDAQARSTAAGRRGLDDRQLTQLLRGDLDWIVTKALEKDRTRRYESAGAFAADIERYLADEPVEARPPSAWYRLRKLARRNRAVIVMAGVVTASLVAATGVSAWQAMKAREAERRATEEAAVARAVNDFLQTDLLRQANRSPRAGDEPGAASGLTVKEALDRAAARIDQRFPGQPLVEAAIRLAIGEAYGSLGWHKLAVAHVERAAALRRESLGTDHPDTQISTHRLAEIYGWVGRSRDAVALLDEMLTQNERRFELDHPATIDCLYHLAEACRQVGTWDRAIPLAEQVLEKRRAVFGPTHPDTVGAMHLLARVFLDAGFLAESIDWHEKTLRATQDSGMWAMKTYARALQGAGRLEEADCHLRKALEVNRKLSDRRAREMEVAMVQKILSLNLLLQGRYVEAEAVARDALLVLEKETPDDWSTFHTMSLIGGALLGQRRYAEAEPFLVQGYEGMKQREALINAGFKNLLTMAGERLIRFYDATNQPEKARGWRNTLAASRPSGVGPTDSR
ncbi:MAG: serine/threonine-protein kinase [Gemmataceae bacterium]